ncbi:hypothetical protein ABLW47_24105, partial [Salmonella enterica]|uniref:hypothetical protein n=1 Tax=Salmonella enterica TaxID=28901 RepID=UPI0032B3B3A2
EGWLVDCLLPGLGWENSAVQCFSSGTQGDSKTRQHANVGYIAKILFALCRINEVDSIWWL